MAASGEIRVRLRGESHGRRHEARGKLDAAHAMADRVVWDGLAFSLLRKACATTPPVERERMLDALGIKSITKDGTELKGIAALQHAGLMDSADRLALPKLGTTEYMRYEDWAHREATVFASRVSVLAGPTSQRFAGCIAAQPACREHRKVGTLAAKPRQRMRYARLAALIATFLLASACSDDSGQDAQEYEAARRSFDSAIASQAATWADPLAEAYLQHQAAGDDAPGKEVSEQFQSQVEELNRFICGQLQDIRKLAEKGPGDKEAGRVDQARLRAQDLVFDAMVAALLNRALATGSERDSLLVALGVEAEDAGAKLVGMAALEDAGILDASGRVAMPAAGTDEYVRYEDTLRREAQGFTSRVLTLTDPSSMKIDECAPPP